MTQNSVHVNDIMFNGLEFSIELGVDRYQAFYDRHMSYVMRYVKVLTRSDTSLDVGEATQETMLSALLAWRELSEIEFPRSWLRRVARNKVIDQQRRNRMVHLVAEPDEAALPIFDGNGVGGLKFVLVAELVNEMFGKLTPAQAEVMHLCMDGWKPSEIAERTGLSDAAVYQHITRYRKALSHYRKHR